VRPCTPRPTDAARGPDRRRARPAGLRNGSAAADTAPEQAKSGEQPRQAPPSTASSRGNGNRREGIELGLLVEGVKIQVEGVCPRPIAQPGASESSAAGPPSKTYDAEMLELSPDLASKTHQPPPQAAPQGDRYRRAAAPSSSGTTENSLPSTGQCRSTPDQQQSRLPRAAPGPASLPRLYVK